MRIPPYKKLMQGISSLLTGTGSISPYSVQMWENTDQKKLRIWTHFTQCLSFENQESIK